MAARVKSVSAILNKYFDLHFFKNEENGRVDIVQNYFDMFITSMCLIYLPSLQYSRPSLLFGQPSCLNLTTVLPQHLNHYHEFSSNLWPFDARHKMEWNQLMVDPFSWNIHLVFVSFGSTNRMLPLSGTQGYWPRRSNRQGSVGWLRQELKSDIEYCWLANCKHVIWTAVKRIFL